MLLITSNQSMNETLTYGKCNYALLASSFARVSNNVFLINTVVKSEM